MQPVVYIVGYCYRFRRGQKKTCASAQVGVIRVFNPKVDVTYQYLWDLNSINPLRTLASKQKQQPFAKCNQRFVFSAFRRIFARNCSLLRRCAGQSA